MAGAASGRSWRAASGRSWQECWGFNWSRGRPGSGWAPGAPRPPAPRPPAGSFRCPHFPRSPLRCPLCLVPRCPAVAVPRIIGHCLPSRWGRVHPPVWQAACGRSPLPGRNGCGVQRRRRPVGIFCCGRVRSPPRQRVGEFCPATKDRRVFHTDKGGVSSQRQRPGKLSIARK